VCESLDSLNSWLEKVEKEISNQETITEEVHELKTQLKTIKVFLLKDFHFLRKLIA
jgi:HPt (histidine-containing phosphotransfer) domain-containing protein